MTLSHAMPSATELLPLLPELVLIDGAFALLIIDLFIGERHKVWTHFLSVLALVVVLAMLATGSGGQGVVLNGMFVRDNAADLMKLAIVLMSTLTLVYGWSYLRERALYKGEIPVLVLFATAGMMMMVSAGSLLMVYLGLELLALCSYALVAADRENGKATEAAMKYIVLGSLASGLLLYGMSLVYGATGSLQLDVIHAAIDGSGERTLLLTGTVFMVAGVAFKLGAAPFHMWLPDVYQGATAPIALFISSAPKLAAFGMAWRLLETGVGPLSEEWRWLLAGLAAISLVVGNLMAIAQANLKRMLAYSTVSHIGFLLMGLASGDFSPSTFGFGGQPSVFMAEVYLRKAIIWPTCSPVSGRLGIWVTWPPRRNTRSLPPPKRFRYSSRSPVPASAWTWAFCNCTCTAGLVGQPPADGRKASSQAGPACS